MAMPNNPGNQNLRKGLQGPLKAADDPDLRGDPEQPNLHLRSGHLSKPRRTRKPSVVRVIQQMKRAGVEIAGCEINPRDGTVRVLAARPTDDIEDTTPIDRGEWN